MNRTPLPRDISVPPPGPRQRRVLLAATDAEFVASAVYHLAAAGYSVSTAGTGDETLASACYTPADVVAVEAALAGTSGAEVLRALYAEHAADTRAASVPPIGVLFVREGDRRATPWPHSVIGGGHVLPAPVRPEALAAHVDALLRPPDPPPHVSDALLTVGDLRIDVAGRRATVAGSMVALTLAEFAILHALALRHGRIVTRGRLGAAIWGTDASRTLTTRQAQTVTMHVMRLRAKLGAAQAAIHAVRGHGYRLNRSPRPSVTGCAARAATRTRPRPRRGALRDRRGRDTAVTPCAPRAPAAPLLQLLRRMTVHLVPRAPQHARRVVGRAETVRGRSRRPVRRVTAGYRAGIGRCDAVTRHRRGE